ncbi:hypothetical protein HZH68_016230 [Vespula germanica]|uniref:Uncharacterized protein n=1 Tax=Vespula germanica TaxID=30212 RepID=A0A834J2C8_VESGE|nr:hypothetical protein HZH68_016230 [Vespula germanica]
MGEIGNVKDNPGANNKDSKKKDLLIHVEEEKKEKADTGNEDVQARELESGKLGLQMGFREIIFARESHSFRGFRTSNTRSNLLSKNVDINQKCKKMIIQYQIYLYSTKPRFRLRSPKRCIIKDEIHIENWKRYVTNYLYLIFSYLVYKNPVLKSMVTVEMR